MTGYQLLMLLGTYVICSPTPMLNALFAPLPDGISDKLSEFGKAAMEMAHTNEALVNRLALDPLAGPISLKRSSSLPNLPFDPTLKIPKSEIPTLRSPFENTAPVAEIADSAKRKLERQEGQHFNPVVVYQALQAVDVPVEEKQAETVVERAREMIAVPKRIGNTYVREPLVKFRDYIKSLLAKFLQKLRVLAEKMRLVRRLRTVEEMTIHDRAQSLIRQISDQLGPLVKVAGNHKPGSTEALLAAAKNHGINPAKVDPPARQLSAFIHDDANVGALIGSDSKSIGIAAGESALGTTDAAAGNVAKEVPPHEHDQLVSDLEGIKKKLEESGPSIEKLAQDHTKLEKESKTIIEMFIDIVKDFRVISALLVGTSLTGGVMAGALAERAASKTGPNNTIVPKFIDNIAFN